MAFCRKARLVPRPDCDIALAFLSVRPGTRQSSNGTAGVTWSPYAYAWPVTGILHSNRGAFFRAYCHSMSLFRMSLRSQIPLESGIGAGASVLPAVSAESPFGSSSLHPPCRFPRGTIDMGSVAERPGLLTLRERLCLLPRY